MKMIKTCYMYIETIVLVFFLVIFLMCGYPRQKAIDLFMGKFEE